MVFTKASEYALKSLSYMVNHPGEGFFGVREIANRLQVSPSYLAKILQKLARHGILKSVTGPRGGFGLAESAIRLPISGILEILDDSEFKERCMLGWAECGDRNPCPFHDIWGSARASIQERLSRLTIGDLSDAIWPGYQTPQKR